MNNFYELININIDYSKINKNILKDDTINLINFDTLCKNHNLNGK